MERDTNRHHLWFERKNYYTHNERALRGLGGFVLDIYAPAHRLLHAQMKPMVKPPRFMQDDIIDISRSIHAKADTRFDVVTGSAEFLLSKPYRTDDANIRAARLANHLLQQLSYFDLHPLPGDPLYE
jgi:hypothetical protein